MTQQQITEAIRACLDKKKMRYKFIEDGGSFCLTFDANSRLGSIDVVVRPENGSYSVFSMLDCKADAQVMDQTVELVTRANYGIIFGGFDFDQHSGTILYRNPVVCAADGLSEDVIEDSIIYVASTVDQYGDAFLGVLMGFVDAKTACEKAEA